MMRLEATVQIIFVLFGVRIEDVVQVGDVTYRQAEDLDLGELLVGWQRR